MDGMTSKKIPLLTAVGKGVFCFGLERTYRRVSVFLKYQGVEIGRAHV